MTAEVLKKEEVATMVTPESNGAQNPTNQDVNIVNLPLENKFIDWNLADTKLITEEEQAIGVIKVNLGHSNKISVYLDGFLSQLNNLGFYKYDLKNGEYNLVCCVNNVVDTISKEETADIFFAWLRKAYNNFNIKGLRRHIFTAEIIELFLNSKHFLFSWTTLTSLPTFDKEILSDTKEDCFFCFLNMVVWGNKKDIISISYEDIGMCVWKKSIIKHEFDETTVKDTQQSQYELFLRNVSGENYNAFRTAIGYLLHGYTSPSQSRAVILYDREITDVGEKKGGTGKGIFSRAIASIRPTTIIDGKGFDGDNQFRYQTVEDDTRIISIDDVNTGKTRFDVFHSVITEGIIIERKHKAAIKIPAEKSPKLLLSANTPFMGEGTTNHRRQLILEFGDYYSSKLNGTNEPILEEHKGIFFSSDWDHSEWNRFYLFMMRCAYLYMEKGLILPIESNVKINKLRQATNPDFAEMVQTIEIGTEKTQKELMDQYVALSGDSDIKMQKFGKWLKLYASIFNLGLRKRSGNGNIYATFVIK